MTEPVGAFIRPLPYESANWSYARDLNHLNLLAIFHYVAGGLSIAFSSIFIFHIVMGVALVTGNFPGGSPPGMPRAFGWMFVVMGSVVVLFGWTTGILCIFSGRCLKRRRHWTFSVVIGSIICLSVPLGTVLGVFTLVVLLRDSVKALYGLAPPAPPP